MEVNYLDILKPYAEYGLTMSQEKNNVGHYSPSISNPGSEESLEWKIMCAIKKFEDKGQITGSQVCVVDGKGQTLANVVSGHLGGLKQNVSMSADTLVFGWSVTKAVSATLAHLMVQEGYLTYDEPICQRVWPAFCPSESAPEELFRSSMVDMDDSIRRWSWKRRITLRHILTHSSGMWSSLPRNSTIEKISSCEKCCAAFEFDVNLPGDTLLPVDEPGKKCIYHFMSFGWLVAGSLMGAFRIRHDREKVTYEEVYDTLLKPRLSSHIINTGFKPCGGTDDKTFTLNDSPFNMSGMVQKRRESMVMGEEMEEIPILDKGKDNSHKKYSDLMQIVRGNEFLLDPRVWNCQKALKAHIPAAAGRFSAEALAHFYHELGTGNIINSITLAKATETVCTESELQNRLQGATLMSSTNLESTKTNFGLGYQIIKLGGTKNVGFGHAGIGGSIGFFHKESNTAVAIMLNKTVENVDVSNTIILAISKYLAW